MCSNSSAKTKVKMMKSVAGLEDEQERFCGVLEIIKGCNSMELSFIKIRLDYNLRIYQRLNVFINTMISIFISIAALLFSESQESLILPIIMVSLGIPLMYYIVNGLFDVNFAKYDYLLLVIEEYQKNPAAFDCELVEGGYEYKVIVYPVRGK